MQGMISFTSMAMRRRIHHSSIIEDAHGCLVRACYFHSIFLPFLWRLLVGLVRNAGLISIAEQDLDVNPHNHSDLRIGDLKIFIFRIFYFRSEFGHFSALRILDRWHWMLSDWLKDAGFISIATSCVLLRPGIRRNEWTKYKNKCNSWYLCISGCLWFFIDPDIPNRMIIFA